MNRSHENRSQNNISGLEGSGEAKRGRKDKYSKLKDELLEMLVSPVNYYAVYAFMSQDETMKKDVQLLQDRVPSLVEHLVEGSKKYEWLFKSLDNFTKVSVSALIIGDILSIAFGLLVNHGKLPNFNLPFLS